MISDHEAYAQARIHDISSKVIKALHEMHARTDKNYTIDNRMPGINFRLQWIDPNDTGQIGVLEQVYLPMPFKSDRLDAELKYFVRNAFGDAIDFIVEHA